MKTLVLSQNSWHYWIASNAADYAWYDHENENICPYLKAVMKGMAVMAVIAVIIAILGSGAWHFIFGIIFSIIYGTYMFTGAGEAVLAILALLAGSGILVGSLYLISRIYWKVWDISAKEGTFIAAAYNSLKGKYCIPITFKE
jgi:ABC-type multidrug transport system permease subunit